MEESPEGMTNIPEHLDYPVKWEWPLTIGGFALFGLGFLFEPGWLSWAIFLCGGMIFSWARFLGYIASLQSWEKACGELARGGANTFGKPRCVGSVDDSDRKHWSVKCCE